MRSKKNREVNIFSASVVDLFASGLGVFLIVSIIALSNQKKADPSQESKVNAELMAEISEMKTELSAQSEELMELKIEKKLEESPSLIRELRKELSESKKRIKELNKVIASSEANLKRGEILYGKDYAKFEIGSKVKMENVHFYPGTTRPIEPYASRELEGLAKYLKDNPRVQIEVSGHIFQSKRRILAGQAKDQDRLSRRRADIACSILQDFGISSGRLNCIGYGSERYLFLTDDGYSEEAQMNRRVEVEILAK